MTLLPNGKVLVAGGFNGSSVLASAELYGPASGTWAITGSLSAARFSHTATLLPNGKVLVAGGFANGATALTSAELYDPANETWTATGSLATGRARHTATLLPNGKVLVAGGEGAGGNTLGSAEIYDPATGAWMATGSLFTAREFHTATLLPNGKVLVAGGRGPSYLASAEIYDPASGTWTSTGSLAQARAFHTATLLPNGKVLVAGGFSGSSTLTGAELYNPASATWTATGSLGVARDSHTATLLPNGKVLVAGGLGTNITSSALASAELYDPASGAWAGTGSFATARYQPTATLLPNGQVLVAGGNGTSGSYLASAELYDSAVGAWATTGSLATARDTHTATLLPNGKVLVAAGYNGGFVRTAELYDSASGTWAATGSLTAARSFHTATLLPNGKVLVAGGENGNPIASAELYDPSSGTWTGTSSPATARERHTATLLPNGKVLVAGGFNVASAELYDPASGTWTATGSLSTTRYQHTATLLPNGRVLVAGGYSGNNRLASAELYDPTSGKWTATGSLASARVNHTATLLPNGKVLVTGGSGNGIASAELYDPASGAWTATGSLVTPREYHSAALLPNGRVLVVGGDSGDFFQTALVGVELYDSATGTWTPTGLLTTGRFDHTATLLPNGKVLAAAGSDGVSAYFASAELYDVGLGFSANSQPQITTASFNASGQLVLTGTRFKGISGGSGGNTQDSPTDSPVVQLRWLDSGESSFLRPDPATPFSATAFTSTAAANTKSGRALVTVFAVGIPSAATMVLSTAPDIAVEQPAGTPLADGPSTVSYGSMLAGTTSDKVFTIRNPGTANLTGLGITFDGANASEFSAIANPTAPVAPGGSTTFTVRFAPVVSGGGGTRNAVLHISSNVSGTLNSFDINLTAGVDAAPPDTTITSTQPTPVKNSSATLTFTGSDDLTPTASLTYEGRLDAAGFATVTSPVTLTGLADGSHTYEVRAKDTFNNVDATPASVTWVVDTVPPTFTLPGPITMEATGPGGAVVTYAASASDAGSGVASSSFAPASGSAFLIGTTTVNATATDQAGNTATGSFTVTVRDTTPPDTTITSTPTAPVRPSVASVSFTGSDAVTPAGSLTYESKMDNGSYAAATSPQTFAGLADGTHTFYVRARDLAGNIDQTPATATFVIDGTPPTLTLPGAITAEATGPNGAAVTYNASATDSNGVASASFTPASGSTFPIGTTTVNASATDNPGNTATASFTVTVRDTTPPDTTITSAPTAPVRPSVASVSFTGSDAVTSAGSLTYESKVDNGSYAATTSPQTFAGLADGTHTFYVRARDLTGNIDQTPATATFVIDGTPPTLTLPGAITMEATGPNGAVVTYNASATDSNGVAGASFTPASGSTFPIGTTTVNATATDNPGNTATGSFTVTVRDLTAPVVTVPANLTVAATSPAGAAVTFAVSATDAVDGIVTATPDPASGSTFPIGTTTVTVTATDSRNNQGSASFTVTVTSAPKLVVEQPAGTVLPAQGGTAPAVDFGSQAAGSAGAPRSFTLRNTGTSALTLTSVAVTGGEAADFAVDTAGLPASVPAGGATTFRVTFTPGLLGARTTTLRILNGDVSPFDIRLTGAGLNNAPTLAIAAPATADEDTAVSFTFTASDPDVADQAAGFAWKLNFGDGTAAVDIAAGTASPLVSSHPFATPGSYTVSATAIDQNGGTSNAATRVIAVADVTAPVFTSVPGNQVFFTDSVAGATVDYGVATATDNSGAAPSITYSKDNGSRFLLDTTRVTVTATDAAGNASTAAFTVTVRLNKPIHTPLLMQGAPAPGHGTTGGPPDDAKLASFGVPAIDDDGTVAFLARWTSAGPPKSLGSGLFTPTNCVAKIGGTTGVAGVNFKTLSDPVIAGGRLAFLATLTGVPVAKAGSVWSGPPTAVALVAQAGDIAPDASGARPTGGATFRTFKAVAVEGGSVAIFAQLSGGTGVLRATAASDLGLWIKDATHPLTLVLREGQMGGNRTIGTLAAFAVGNGSPGQGRGWLTQTANGPRALALAKFTGTDKAQAVLGAGFGGTEVLAQNNPTSAVPDIAGASFVSYGMPAMNPEGRSAFLASLAVARGGPATAASSRGLFVNYGNSTYTKIARVTEPAGATDTTFSLLKDPVLAEDDALAFPATLKATKTVKGLATTTLWWKRSSGSLQLLAQGGPRPVGQPIPGLRNEAQWKTFPSLAIAAGRGPLFSATLLAGKGGVTAATSSGVWAADYAGAPRLLFQTGIADALVAGRTLQSFTLLKTAVGSIGVTRSFNNVGQLVWLAKFTDRTTALIETDIP